MKSFISLLSIAALTLTTFVPALSAHAATLTAGDLIKASGQAVYYYAADGKRYVFPTEKTYKSWYTDFTGIKTVSDAELAAIQIGGNVTYRPGIRLVKVTTDPKVYAIEGLRLRWVASEAIAIALFGANWASQVDDIPDAFFINYRSGADIINASDYLPSVVRDAASTIQIVLAERTTTTPTPTTPTTPPVTNDVAFTLTANKTQAQINEPIDLSAQAPASSTVSSLKITLDGNGIIASCTSFSCFATWTVPSAGAQTSYTFRGTLTLANGHVQETTLTIPIVTTPVSSLIRITANRFMLKPNQLPNIHAIVQPEIRASRTDIYVNGNAVKTCSTTPHDCPYNDVLAGPIGTTFIVHAVVQTSDYLTYQSPSVTFVIAENDTPAISLLISPSPVRPGSTVHITLTAEDDDGIGQTQIIAADDGTVLKTCVGAAPCSLFTWVLATDPGAVETFIGRATDLKNAVSTTTASVRIE